MKLVMAIMLLLLANRLFAHSQIDDPFMPAKEIVATYNYRNYHLDMLDILSKDVEVLGVNLKTKQIDLFLSKFQFAQLQQAGYNLEVSSDKNAPMAPDAEYKNPQEIAEFLQQMHERYPNLTKLVSVGKSLEGRDIWALKISDNAEVDEKEPAILINGMHHAREVMTPEVVIDMISYLLENYQSDSKVTEWVDRNEIWALPMLNVDGNNKVWTGDSMWRKNTRGGYGVDINRNYPYEWGKCRGSSPARWAQDYRGPSAASEPETQALMSFVERIRPVFDISFHSYSELVIYPFGCRGKRTPTHEVISKIGKDMAALMDYTPGTPWETLYAVDGGDIDWMYDAYQVIPYVIEVNSSSEGFQPRYDMWRDKTVKLVRKSWMLLLDRLIGSGVRGEVKTFLGESVSDYTVEVLKADGSLFQNYRANPDGTFHIILNPGEYKLNLKREGRKFLSKDVSIKEKREDISFEI